MRTPKWVGLLAGLGAAALTFVLLEVEVARTRHYQSRFDGVVPNNAGGDEIGIVVLAFLVGVGVWAIVWTAVAISDAVRHHR